MGDADAVEARGGHHEVVGETEAQLRPARRVEHRREPALRHPRVAAAFERAAEARGLGETADDHRTGKPQEPLRLADRREDARARRLVLEADGVAHPLAGRAARQTFELGHDSRVTEIVVPNGNLAPSDDQRLPPLELFEPHIDAFAAQRLERRFDAPLGDHPAQVAELASSLPQQRQIGARRVPEDGILEEAHEARGARLTPALELRAPRDGRGRAP